MSSLTAELTPQYTFSPHTGLPRVCTSLLNRACDLFWEARFGIRTAKGAEVNYHDARAYGALAYNTYFRIFDRLGLKRDDVVVDIGCGKGRVVCVAATYPIKQAVGIDIDPSLITAANQNANTMRGAKAPVRFVCQSATEFNYTPATTIVLVSPFGEETMEKTLNRINESLEENPRDLKIVYANPVLSPMLAEKPWLKLFENWTPSKWSRVKFPIHFYKTVCAMMAALIKRATEITEVAERCPVC